ncbi:MAG: hypothetical protein AAF438_08105 [Pseudomonadota bacterium]
MNQDQKKSNRGALWALVALFLGPLILAWVLYFTGVWRPTGFAHHGNLIEPVINLAEQLENEEDKAALNGKWTLIQVVAHQCDAACRTLESRIGQVRLALGHRRDRVQRMMVQLDGLQFSAKFEDPTLKTVQLPSDSEFAQSLEKNKLEQLGNAIFVADPVGNLILVYAADVGQKELLEDLKRLLRLSRIG